ncbi:Hsp20/alpha crystallin family protein [Candidatus Saccharibacteria bacterium]|nr:Hsp20/alpha crystallin family protein [Candidatus Saccharibacteria bacterium]
MARTNEDALMEKELADAFLDDDDSASTSSFGQTEEEGTPESETPAMTDSSAPEESDDDTWETADDFPGQLAVDVYETADKLVVKARTAGISKNDLDVSISEQILTISGVLSGGEDESTTRWHIQECYWGEFSRTIALPVPVREDENSVKAELKDGVLTITFDKVKTEAAKRIQVQ